MRKPKAITLTLEPWSDPNPGRLYEARIKSVSDRGKRISVTLENLDRTMAGRVHRTELPQNLHPGNRTHRFAIAAGLGIETLGMQIDLRDAVGKLIHIRFIPVDDDYEIEFEKLKNSDQAERGRDNPSEHRDNTDADEAGWDR